MTDTNWTVALAGSGEVTPENALALLDDWLPVEGVGLLFPKLPRNAKLMRYLAKWAESENIDVMPDQANIIEGLVGAQADGDQVYLVLAWDDTEASSKLLEEALGSGIPVKDLTKALDDLEFEDDNNDEPDVPAEVPESRGRRTSQREATDTDADDGAEDTDSGSADVPEPNQVGSAESDTPVVADAGLVVQATATGPATVAPSAEGTLAVGTYDIAFFVEEWVRAIVRDEYAIITAKPEKADVPVLVDEDGNYRLGGKGRPRKGETATHVTPTQARELGLILDEED